MHLLGITAAGRKQRDGACTPQHRRARTLRAIVRSACAAVLATTLVALGGCSENDAVGKTTNPSGSQSQTSGPAYERPELALSPFDQAAAGGENGVSIDASSLAKGYVAVSATASTRLKFQISFEGSETQYYFDLPSDGTPISCPLVQGSGAYTFTVWENTTGQRYSELYSLADQPVTLADEFQPFIRPSVYCDYDASSKSTQLANDLSADAQNEGDVVRGIYDWIVENIAYDEDKAARLADATGYLPNPDSCIADGSGICFDYASLAAAMLRSQGIPCKIITGYVSPDNIYHAWNMVYIDGTWVDAHIDIKQNTWTRIDTTFAAGSGSSYVGDGIATSTRTDYDDTRSSTRQKERVGHGHEDA